ncbi:type VII secretion protein EccB [Streptomyces albiaxialis]|uniref:Type VII secretion protein EccB n=1 Tax=Streptomyces albiaxialis TaxID=329523 RepID=A0ABP5IS68_9ACTN
MASRRDELNAYTFAKKRLVAAFLQPSPTGTEEGAPRPLRGILPGIIIGVLILAGFGAWGMFKPKAPEGWDEPEAKVIIGSESTTRYVVLKTGKKVQLHPVLNLASAKLLLDPGQGEVVKVDEKVLDKGDIPHGATLGIPYAPDRLPAPEEAAKRKRWAVCERPSQGGRAVQKSAFVLAERDEHRVEGRNRLRGGELLYVKGPDDKLYVVDKKGRKYRLAENELLLRLIVENRKPQRVSRQWLATLDGDTDVIDFPRLRGTVGEPAGQDGLAPGANRVGTVLRASSGAGSQHYVVLRSGVHPVTDFMAHLLLNPPGRDVLKQNGKAMEVSAGSFTPSGIGFGEDLKWPTAKGEPVNEARPSAAKGGRDTVCNVLRGVDGRTGKTTLSTWAGETFPAQLPSGATSAYVTPGTGQLFRQVKGENAKDGGVFLVTDTGLRYATQGTNDTEKGDPGSGKARSGREEQEGQNAQRRLGYEGIKPTPVPAAWSEFLPTGPRLSTGSAKQPQGS